MRLVLSDFVPLRERAGRRCLGTRVSTWTVCLLAGVATVVRAGDDRNAVVTDTLGSELVRQLGSDEFSTRERATAKLIRLGGQSIGALQVGAESGDREIRFRCTRILAIVRDRELDRRLSVLLNDRNSGTDYGLAGWLRYRELVGDSPESRRLFVEMSRAESEILQAVDTDKESAGKAVVERLLRLSFANPQRTPTKIGTFATLLFAAGFSGTYQAGPAGFDTGLADHLHDRSFIEAAKSGGEKEILQKLLGHWLLAVDDSHAFHAMRVAYECETPEGLILAERTIRQSVQTLQKQQQGAEAPAPPGVLRGVGDSQVLTRQMALYMMIKLGGEKQIPLVEGLLEDTSQIGKQQIRDLALFALVRCSGQSLSDYGFSRSRNGEPTTQISTVLESDDIRQKSLQKWRESRAPGKGK